MLVVGIGGSLLGGLVGAVLLAVAGAALIVWLIERGRREGPHAGADARGGAAAARTSASHGLITAVSRAATWPSPRCSHSALAAHYSRRRRAIAVVCLSVMAVTASIELTQCLLPAPPALVVTHSPTARTDRPLQRTGPRRPLGKASARSLRSGSSTRMQRDNRFRARGGRPWGHSVGATAAIPPAARHLSMSPATGRSSGRSDHADEPVPCCRSRVDKRRCGCRPSPPAGTSEGTRPGRAGGGIGAVDDVDASPGPPGRAGRRGGREGHRRGLGSLMPGGKRIASRA
jgi:hypothetical protein